MSRFVMCGAIAVSAMLLAVNPSHAQMGPGQLGPLWQWQGPGGEYYETGGYENENRNAGEPETEMTIPAESASYYSGPAASRSVLLRLWVPADAQVWIDGTPTSSTGELRSYISPPLNPGENYVYNLRVQSRVGVQTRSVPIHSGDRINLDFRTKAQR